MSKVSALIHATTMVLLFHLLSEVSYASIYFISLSNEARIYICRR